MKLDDLKKEIEKLLASVNEAGEIKNYFCLIGYDYPNFSLHMDISSRELACMFFRASLDNGILREAILSTAALIKAKQEGE